MSLSTNALSGLWRRSALAFALFIGALLLLFWPTFVQTAQVWKSDTYMHGVLVPGIVLWLVWRRRDELRHFAPAPSAWGLLGLLACAAVWLLGNLADLAVVEQLAVWSAVSLGALTMLGVAVSRALMFPLVYMIFAVPMGEELIPLLMDITAWFTVSAVRMTGIPVYQEGHLFQLPSGMFEVAKACSGIRYLIASVALGALYAYLTYASYWRRAWFLLVAILLPIVANGLRAYGIVLIAHYSNMQYAVGVDHFIYGWIFFGLVIFLMFWLGARWREPEAVLEAPSQVSTVTVSRSVWLLYVTFAVGVLWGTHQLGYRLSTAPEGGYPAVSLMAPDLAGWARGEAQDASDWTPSFKGHGAQWLGHFKRQDQQLAIYAVAYGRQAPGAEVANSENTLYDRKKWIMTTQLERDVVMADGHSRRVRIVEVGRPGAKRAIAFWYDVAGTVANQWIFAKGLDVWARFTHPEGYRASLVAIAVTYGEQDKLPESLLLEVLAQLNPGAMGVKP